MLEPTHYSIDFQEVSQFICKSQESIKIMLSNLVRILEMTPVNDPVIEYMQDPDNSENGGITAVQIIKESLIDVHTYGEHRAIYISIFSCRRFEILKVVDFLVEFLGSKRYWVNCMRRMRLND